MRWRKNAPHYARVPVLILPIILGSMITNSKINDAKPRRETSQRQTHLVRRQYVANSTFPFHLQAIARNLFLRLVRILDAIAGKIVFSIHELKILKWSRRRDLWLVTLCLIRNVIRCFLSLLRGFCYLWGSCSVNVYLKFIFNHWGVYGLSVRWLWDIFSPEWRYNVETVLPFSVLWSGCVWCRDMVLYSINILS